MTRPLTIRAALAVSLVALSAPTLAFAEPRDNPMAHVHGVASLAVVVENGQLSAEFISPAADIAGFEHAPRTAEEQAAVETATQTLRNVPSLMQLDAAAGCAIMGVQITAPAADEDDHDHGHDHGHDHDHGTHADFMARYLFQCENANRLETIRLSVFESFPSLERIEVTYLGPDRQTMMPLTPDAPVFNLR